MTRWNPVSHVPAFNRQAVRTASRRMKSLRKYSHPYHWRNWDDSALW